MTDVHLHLLPGVDDGAPDEATAVGHARRMVAAGVTEAVCTPHVKDCFPDVAIDEIEGRTQALQAVLDADGIGLRLHPGGELDWRRATELTGEELDAIAFGPPDARRLLLETPFAGIGAPFGAVAEELMAAGFGLVLAHPERAAGALGAARPHLDRLVAAGCLLQVNTGSLLGEYGHAPYVAGTELVRGGRAWLLASDGHPGMRDEPLTTAARRGLARAGVAAAAGAPLFEDRPHRLLHPRAPAPALRA